eukprot:5959184-Alexandrium_andersonii.AAC.1
MDAVKTECGMKDGVMHVIACPTRVKPNLAAGVARTVCIVPCALPFHVRMCGRALRRPSGCSPRSRPRLGRSGRVRAASRSSARAGRSGQTTA